MDYNSSHIIANKFYFNPSYIFAILSVVLVILNSTCQKYN
jgi:hypothetical protein